MVELKTYPTTVYLPAADPAVSVLDSITLSIPYITQEEHE